MQEDDNNNAKGTESKSPKKNHIIAVLTLLVAIGQYVIANRSERTNSPFFTISMDPDDNLNMVTTVRNQGGNITNVHCKWVTFVSVIYKRGNKEKKVWTMIDLESEVGRYDYESNEIKITQSMLKTPVNFVSLFEPLLLFNLQETLNEEYYQKAYSVREIDYDFMHCIKLEYKNYTEKDCCVYLKLTNDGRELLDEKDIPKVESSSVFFFFFTTPEKY